MCLYSGNAILLDRDNINTDEIMPAKYLTFIDRLPLKSHLLEDLVLPGFDPQKIDWSQYQVVISRSNFGCGSSREMAVWGFEVNGISILIASNFARIFRENAFNCGILAIELNTEQIDEIFTQFATAAKIEVQVFLDNKIVILSSLKQSLTYSFSITKWEEDLVSYGGLINLSNEKY